MRFLGSIADWWDTQRRDTMRILDNWVADTRGGEQTFAVVVAGTLQTAMDLGQGFVDVLRIGEGVQQGTARGVAHDGLRLLTIAGPAARGLRLSGRLISRFTSVAADTSPSTGICSWVSGANALRATGIRHGATAADVMAAASGDAAAASAAATGSAVNIAQLVPTLRAMGANPGVGTGVSSMQALINFVRQASGGGRTLTRAREGGVTLFSIFWEHPQQHATVGHTLAAYIDALGRFRILDRTGRVFSSLAEMEGLYPGISNVTGWGNFVAHVPDALALRAASAAGSILNVIGFELNSVLISNQPQPARSESQPARGIATPARR
jgi:hypothetical protein